MFAIKPLVVALVLGSSSVAYAGCHDGHHHHGYRDRGRYIDRDYRHDHHDHHRHDGHGRWHDHDGYRTRHDHYDGGRRDNGRYERYDVTYRRENRH